MKPDPYDFEMYLWSNGAAYCDEDGQMAGQIDSKESQEVFKMFQDMEKTDMQLQQKRTELMNSVPVQQQCMYMDHGQLLLLMRME